MSLDCRPEGMLGKPRRPSQHGAALLTVLLVVALAATVVSGLIWRAGVETHRVANQQRLYQARRVLDSAQSWAASLLRWQATRSTDATWLGGLWALPLPPTRLDRLPGLSIPAGIDRGLLDQVWLSGRIEDAEGRFNLTDLIRRLPGDKTDIDPSQLAVLHRLLQSLQIDPSLARPIADRVLRLSAGLAATNAPPLHSLDQLLEVTALTPAMLDRLRPYLVALPESTPVNANTASAIVLGAAIPALSTEAIANLVDRRQHVFLRQLADLQLIMQSSLPPTVVPDLGNLDVDSHYFIIRMQARIDQVTVHRDTLIYRAPRTQQTQIIPQ